MEDLTEDLSRFSLDDLCLDLLLELVRFIVDLRDAIAPAGCLVDIDLCYLLSLGGSTLQLVAYHDQSDIILLFMEHEDLYYPYIADLHIQLLLKMVCWFIVDLCDGNVVHGFSSAFTSGYFLLLLGLILWFATYIQSE